MNNLYVATRKGLFTLHKKNGVWAIRAHTFIGEPVTIVMPDKDGKTLYAALNLGHFGVKLHRSDDNGGHWKEVNVPTYPEQPAGSKKEDWDLKVIWCMENGHDKNSLWAGTLPGGLFYSGDKGKSWALNEALWNTEKRKAWFGGGFDLPGIHSICPDPEREHELSVAVSCGGVWKTRDGGESWKQCAHGMRAEFMPEEKTFDPDIQDPHKMVQCKASPETFWVQHHNGIFKSTDRANSWYEIHDVSPSAFGFATVVHPSDPDTAWFVPAVKDECRLPVDSALVVNRTRDGGKSFETLRTGLPQKHAYDLVLRHAMDISSDGNSLAFGSSTGGLWVSEDQGDSWGNLSLNLPPVYSIRFSV